MLEYMLRNTPRLAEKPVPFGVFHLVSLGIFLALFVLMLLFRKHLPRGERALRISLVIFGVGLLLLEIGKQIVYSFDPVTGWAYHWDRFPFQFCSVPIYVALVAMLLSKGKLRSALVAFLATYSPVAGASVLCYPSSTVFSEIIFLNIHTMLWHGAMLLYGLYLWLSESVTPHLRTAGEAALVYAPLNFIALGLNEASYAFGFARGYDFNMFYTGRMGRCLIPVLSDIQRQCPYPVFFLSYLLTLGMGGLLVTLCMMLIRWIAQRRRLIYETKK